MPPKPPKPDVTSADTVSVTSGNFLSADRGIDLLAKVSGIERSVTYLEAHAQEADKKLDALRLEFSSAKGSLKVLIWICGIAGTLLVSTFSFIVYVAEQVLRHYLGR